MRFESLGQHVRLSQGLAVNKGNADLFSDIQTEEFPYPLLRIVDFGNEKQEGFSKYVTKDVSKSVIIDEETIVFTRVTCECFRGYKGVLHNNLFAVEIESSDIIEDYLYTVLQSEFVKKQAANLTSSSVVPDLSHEMFKSIVIPIPEIVVQKKIAETYLLLTEKIQINKKINREMDLLVRSLYEYYFVQFDYPDINGRPYKSSGGAMIWNQELKREIPEGWNVYRLAECLDCNKNSMGKNNMLEEIQYLDTSNLTDNRLDNLYRITNDEGYPSRAKRVVKENDILFSMVRPEQKHFGILKKVVPNMVASTGYAVLSSNISYKYNDLFYLFLTSDINVNALNTIANSSVSSYPSINSDDILNLKMALPNEMSCLDDIMDGFSDIHMKIFLLQKENKELLSVRDYLLPMLLNGQLEFGE